MNNMKTLTLLFVLSVITIVALSSCNASEIINDTSSIEKDSRSINTETEFYSGKIEKRPMKDNMKTNSNLYDLSLQTDDIICDYGDSVDINVITTPEVDEGILSWYFNGRLIGAKNLSKSAATYTINTIAYTPGTYSILVSYGNSLNYINNQTTATLTINKLNVSISDITYTFDEDNNIIVDFGLVDSKGNGIDYGTLNVYNDTYLVTSLEVEDYSESFTLDKKYNGEVIRFEYIGDEYYNDVQEDELVWVEKYSANIYLAYMSSYQSDIVNENIRIYSDRKVNDGCLNVYIDDVLMTNIPVESSTSGLVIDTANLLAGTHKVYIEYVDSDVYNDATYQTTLTVNQIKTKTNSYNLTAHRNDLINLIAKVYNYIETTHDGLVEFIIDNESINTENIKNGTANTTYLIPDNLNYGIHNITIIYYGNTRYNASNTTCT